MHRRSYITAEIDAQASAVADAVWRLAVCPACGAFWEYMHQAIQMVAQVTHQWGGGAWCSDQRRVDPDPALEAAFAIGGTDACWELQYARYGRPNLFASRRQVW